MEVSLESYVLLLLLLYVVVVVVVVVVIVVVVVDTVVDAAACLSLLSVFLQVLLFMLTALAIWIAPPA